MKRINILVIIFLAMLRGMAGFAAIADNVLGVFAWEDPLKLSQVSDQDITRVEKIAKIFHDLVSREEYLAAYSLMSPKIVDQLTVLEFMQEQDWLNKKYGIENSFSIGVRPFSDLKSLDVSGSPSMIFASFISSRQKKVHITIGIRQDGPQWRICYWAYAIVEDNVKAEYRAF